MFVNVLSEGGSELVLLALCVCVGVGGGSGPVLVREKLIDPLLLINDWPQ